MRVMITGAAGMLGTDVCAAARAAGHEAVGLARAELDITDSAAVAAAVDQASPDVIINCAAWTDVDGAETATEDAFAVNAAGAGHVARAAAACGAWTIHVSTDYVFDGRKSQPYIESDPVAPTSVYGRSKLEGEFAVAHEAPARHTIVRSSWLFGNTGPCFPKTILRLAAERPSLTVVDDQVGCPTFTPHLAGALLTLAEMQVPGVVHVAGSGDCSWFEFAVAIVGGAGLACDVRPGTTADLDRPAPRPAYSVLRTEHTRDAPHLPHWRKGLATFLSAAAVPAP
jgi:dTDP-4-dehydrorhamnose reductase